MITVTRMAQDQVVTAEKIFVDIICMPKGTSLEDIRSLFRFKGKDYIVKKPKGCLDVSPVIQVKMSETEETDIRTVPVFITVVTGYGGGALATGRDSDGQGRVPGNPMDFFDAVSISKYFVHPTILGPGSVPGDGSGGGGFLFFVKKKNNEDNGVLWWETGTKYADV
ncbi:hypothetical protein Tco_0826645 [Tanacetum coccineum]